jgi:hypothetical protein
VKYALLIYNNGPAGAACAEDMMRSRDASAEHFAQHVVSGVVQLRPVATATTVRVDNGQTLLTDGPFVESKEYLGGFFLFEGANLDEAIAVAARIQAARPGGAIEMRPIVE